MIPSTTVIRDEFSRVMPTRDPWAVMKLPEENYVISLRVLCVRYNLDKYIHPYEMFLSLRELM